MAGQTRLSRFKRLVILIPLGVVLILIEGFIFVNVPAWRSQIIVIILLTAFMFSFGSPTTEKVLLRTSFLKSIPKFIGAWFITFSVLFVVGKIIGGSALPSISTALSDIPISLILVHSFIIAVNEELMFRGWLWDQLVSNGLTITQTIFITSGIFGLFHFFTAGGILLMLIWYSLLGVLFATIKIKFSPETNTANMGAHGGWNSFVLAFGEILNKLLK